MTAQNQTQMTTLLRQALAVKRRPTGHGKRFSDEEVQLALGWLRGELTQSQVSSVVPYGTGSGIYLFLARAIRQHFQTQAKKQ